MLASRFTANFQRLNAVIRLVSTNNQLTQPTNDKWDLVTAVCLERKAIVTAEPTPIERKFAAYLAQVELERSMKSKHEVRHEQDLLFAEKLKKGEVNDLDLDNTGKTTAQDMEDASNEELAKFTFADRLTEADKTNDRTSVDRKLDKHLVLLVEQQIGEKKVLALPQSMRQQGETMRQAADRTVNEICGNGISRVMLGNAPCGFYKYKYPKSVRSDAVGAKIFFYFARYRDGTLPTMRKFMWLDREELKQTLPKVYHKSVSRFLIDE